MAARARLVPDAPCPGSSCAAGSRGACPLTTPAPSWMWRSWSPKWSRSWSKCRPLEIAVELSAVSRSFSLDGAHSWAGRGLGVVEGVAGGVQAVEVAVGTDLVGEPEAIEFATDVVVGFGNREDDPPLAELVGQLQEGLRAAVVDVVDRVGVQHQPARRIGDVHQAHDLLEEELHIGVEDPNGKPVDDQAGLADRARGGLGQPELSLPVPAHDRVVGGDVPLDVHDQRQDDRQYDPLLDADG